METTKIASGDGPSAESKGLLSHGFWPIKLERRMRLYRDAIGLEDGRSSAPDLDFLFKILTPYPSHQAMLRDSLKSSYKSLENYLRGKRPVSPAKVAQLAAMAGIDADRLHVAPHGHKTGPLWPELQQLLWWIESVAAGAFGAATSTAVLCPNCGANVIDDVDPWWNNLDTSYGLRLGRAEYRFAERLLRALVGYVALTFFLARLGPDSQPKRAMGADLVRLANASKHPIGTWLVEVMGTRRCATLQDLLIASPMVNEEEDGLSRQRLKAWSSGLELIPFSIGEDLVRDLSDSAELLLHFRLARCLAFVQDFIVAAADSPPPRHLERRIVFDRLQSLLLNVRLSRTVVAGATLRPAAVISDANDKK